MVHIKREFYYKFANVEHGLRQFRANPPASENRRVFSLAQDYFLLAVSQPLSLHFFRFVAALQALGRALLFRIPIS
jgi:hypothetical protein